MYETDSAAEMVEEMLAQELGGDGSSREYYGELVPGEAELASELLDASSDHELDQFFGKIIQGVGKLAKSPAAKMLAGAARGLAKKALPVAGAAVGNMIMPGIGGMVGGNLAGALGSAVGLEGEGLSGEDEQHEVAKRVVRATQQAAQQVASDPRAGSQPKSAVKDAVSSAVRTHLPGLAKSGTAAPGAGNTAGRTGRWIRQGNKIVLMGL